MGLSAAVPREWSVVQTYFAIPNMILAETVLSFLGLGMKPPAISWGVLLRAAQQITVVVRHPWLLLLVAPFIILTVLSFNFLGDAARDAADPYESRRA